MSERSSSVAEQARQLFDAKAADWPKKYLPTGRLVGRISRFSDKVEQDVPAGSRILDLGCGTGELARTLVAGGFLVTACDISGEMLTQARLTDDAGAVSWVRLEAGWRTLPFEASAFDVVVASSVLEYVADPVGVLRQCARVIRPGGVMLCTVPDMTHPERWLELCLQQILRPAVTRIVRACLPSLGGYLTYLHISRHRKPIRWWQRIAELAGLEAMTLARQGGRSPLRLLMFRRSDRGRRS